MQLVTVRKNKEKQKENYSREIAKCTINAKTVQLKTISEDHEIIHFFNECNRAGVFSKKDIM